MGASDPRRWVAPALAWAALLIVGSGCSGGPQPELGTRPTEAKAEIERTKQAADSGEGVALPPTDEAAAEAAAATPKAPTSAPGPGVGINSRGGKRFESAQVEEPEEEPELTLWEASQRERQRRRSSESAQIVITNDNLADFATGGAVTELVTEGGADEGAEATPQSNPIQDDPELYWRTVARDARLAWRAAHDRVAELEAEVAKLRFDFYSTDDPHHRDGEIKPAWDRAALQLEQARLRVADLRLQVERVLEAGYKAGALPGWLREGIEFEPAPDEDEDPSTEVEPGELQAIEPPVAQEPPR